MLMPSPVIAATLPARCNAWMICSLLAGLTRENDYFLGEPGKDVRIHLLEPGGIENVQLAIHG